MPKPDPTPEVKRGELSAAQKAAAGGGLALALAATVSILQVWEGKVNDPHWDRYGKVWDVCYGETRVAMRHYSDAECAALLAKAAGEFQAIVLKLNPRLRTDPYQLAAHTSFTYNLGEATYRKSSVRRLYAVGQEAAACQAITSYRYAGGKVLRGLELRRLGDATRLGEKELCLTPDPGLGRP